MLPLIQVRQVLSLSYACFLPCETEGQIRLLRPPTETSVHYVMLCVWFMFREEGQET